MTNPKDKTLVPVEQGYHKQCEYCDGETPCANCDGSGYIWTDQPCTLADAPVGLFWCGETLALKSEYGNNEGRIDAYIVSSGEYFWGHPPQTIASQRATMVRPMDHDRVVSALASSPTPAPVSGEASVADLQRLGQEFDAAENNPAQQPRS